MDSPNSTIEYIQPKGRYITVGAKVWIIILLLWWFAIFLVNYSAGPVETGPLLTGSVTITTGSRFVSRNGH
jgi:hypothetical protein